MFKLVFKIIKMGILMLSSLFKSKKLQKLNTTLQVIECAYLVLTA